MSLPPSPSPSPFSHDSLSLSSLNSHFLDRTYLFGSSLSQGDLDLALAVRQKFPDSAAYSAFPSFCRWFDLVQRDPRIISSSSISFINFPRFSASTEIFNFSIAEFRANEAKNRPTEKSAKEVAAAPKEKKTDEAPKVSKNSDSKEKKEEKKVSAPAPGAIPAVYRCDFRVGKIVSAESHPTDSKCIVQKIDFGEGKVRVVVSGVAEFYSPADLTGRLVVGLINLETANIKGVESFGRLMVATSADGKSKEFATPPEGAAVGERIFFDGVDAKKSPADAAVASKNTHKIFKELRTNEKCEVAFAELLFKTSAGPCTVKSIANGTVQ